MKTLNIILADSNNKALNYVPYLQNDYRFFPKNFVAAIEKETTEAIPLGLPIILIQNTGYESTYLNEDEKLILNSTCNMTYISENGNVFSMSSSKRIDTAKKLLEYHIEEKFESDDKVTIIDLSNHAFDSVYSKYESAVSDHEVRKVDLCEKNPLNARDTIPIDR